MVQNAFQYKKFFYLKKTPYSLAIIFMLSASLAGLLFCNALGLKDYAGDKILSFFGDCTTIESADYQLPFCAMSPIINYFSPDKLRSKRRLASKTASVLESAFILCALTAVAIIAFYKRFQAKLKTGVSNIINICVPKIYSEGRKRILFALLI